MIPIETVSGHAPMERSTACLTAPYAALPAQRAPEFSHWDVLVDQIRRREPGAVAEFYSVFRTSVRNAVARQLAWQDQEDIVHDTFLTVLGAIQRGEIREPARLMGFVRTVVRRHVAAYIETAVQKRNRHSPLDASLLLTSLESCPEHHCIRRQRDAIVLGALDRVSDRDRQILVRFYYLEQSRETICREMGLTETQFRLLKSRAKARFGALGRKQIRLAKHSVRTGQAEVA
jgi:RNA polymerase sigma factor (sigma-70 family)